MVPLVLPYISEYISNKIRNYIKSNKLPLRLIFKPGVTLKNSLCRSRPLDKKLCVLGNQENCMICPNLTGISCAMKDTVYIVICELCWEKYNGETERWIHSRGMEHRIAAINPDAHPENAVGQHYRHKHPGMEPKLQYKALDRQSKTVRRKISEAISILRDRPEMNDKNELTYLVKYMIE